ncbi:TonB family protein [Pelagicoccus sp. SDUM812005]|uniref:energy transducer TonB n=1 Tax=Pelagicoccus sp. SDUM812005 TaxID=3041257 RepID=UPI00280E28B8|nr:TonB family protein [Pelagicoccus sp. SDUM812005]MDQ8179010.1 TonB family protein [Pelagicoccus sp. SDUM812005]
MSHIYTQVRIPLASNLKALALGALGVTAIFALLPILMEIPNPFKKVELVPAPDVPIDLPDPLIVEPPEPIVEKPPLKVEELEVPPPPITLDQMALLLDPSDNGVGVAVDSGRTFLDDRATGIVNFLPSELDQQPRALVATKPLYPYSMQHSKTAGQVTVEFVIDENGRVLRPRIVKSSHREFEQAALEAVLKSKWQPGRKGGKDVRTLVRLPVNFKP